MQAEEGIVESFPPVQQASEVPDMEAAFPWQKPAPSGGSEGENHNFKATNVATESGRVSFLEGGIVLNRP